MLLQFCCISISTQKGQNKGNNCGRRIRGLIVIILENLIILQNIGAKSNQMIVSTLRIKLYAPTCHSLKDKRMIVKSLLQRTRNKFNVSIAETEEQDYYQTIVIGIACVSSSRVQANAVLDEVMHFIEGNTEAEIIDFLFEDR